MKALEVPLYLFSNLIRLFPSNIFLIYYGFVFIMSVIFMVLI